MLREVVKGKMYALEQTQGLLNVIVNVRILSPSLHASLAFPAAVVRLW